MTTAATSGSGVQFKMGDGGVGAGTQASKTIGTSNQQLRVKAREAGTAGNSKTFGITVSGNNTSYAQTITANSVAITSATDGSGVATTTVLQAISNLYLDTTFLENFIADVSSGNGSGVLVAGASGVLSGGTDGAEIFTKIAEVKSLNGFNASATVIDVTNMDSLNNYREYISSWLDAGEVSFAMNFLPGNVTQQEIYTVMQNREARNYQLIWSDAASTVCELRGIVTGFQITNQIDAALEANITIKLTGAPVWF